MADDFKISINTDLFEKELDEFGEAIAARVREATQIVAETAFAQVYEKAYSMGASDEHVQKYLAGLRFNRMSDKEWVISLEGDFPNQLEQGVPAYDMREQLKSGGMVSQGPRAGQPWVRKSKAGNKYAAVPLSQRLSGVNRSDLASTIKSLSARGRNGVLQNITETYRDVNTGSPLLGKVATATNTGVANLENLTKYQALTKAGKIRSLYMTYRTMSENPNSKGWMHKGYPAINAMDGINEFVESALLDILKEME